MAWRLHEELIEGMLDNTVRGKVTGWMRFAGLDGQVAFDLSGDFHRDIAGCRIVLTNPEPRGERKDMEGLSPVQKGTVGDITAGLPPRPYSPYPYVEWYSDDNGRIVLELKPEQVQVIGGPAWTPEQGEKFDAERRRSAQAQFNGFLQGMAKAAGCPAIGVGGQRPKRSRVPPASSN